MSFPDEGSTYAILRRSIRLKWHRLRCLSPLHSGPAPLLPSTLYTGQYPSLRSLLGYFFALPMLPCRNITATHHPNRRIWPQLREESALASPCKWCLERICCKGWGKKHVVEKKKNVFFFLIENNVSSRSNANYPNVKALNAKRTNLLQLELHSVRDMRAFAWRRAARILHHAAPQIWAKLRDCNVKGGGRAFSQPRELLARCLPFTFTPLNRMNARSHILAMMYLHR